MKYVNHFIAFIFMCLSLYASAEVEKDGLTYEVIDGEYLKLISVSDKLKGELTIPDSVFVSDSNCNLPVKTLGKFSFNECDSIYSVVFPHTLEAFESPLFFYCRGLKKVDMGNTQVTCLPDNNIGCISTLEEIILPPNLHIIGKGALSGLQFEKFKIPDTVEFLDDRAFQNSEIKELDLGNAPVLIGQYVFYGCENLTKVKWSSSMTELNHKCFHNTSISDVVIHKSMTYIMSPFAELKTLKNVYCLFENPDDLWIRSAFWLADLSDCILWVPEGSEELYRNHEEWQGFKEVRGFDPAKIDNISVNSAQYESGTFDLMGRKITTPQPGQIYIDKGQKKLELVP